MLRAFGFQLYFGNFRERNQDFLAGAAFDDLGVHVVRGDAGDAFGHVFAAGGFDHHDEIFFGGATDDAEEAGELGLDKATIESESAALKDLGLGRSAAGSAFGVSEA